MAALPASEKPHPVKVNLLGAPAIVQVADPLPHLTKQTDGAQRRVARFHRCIYNFLNYSVFTKNLINKPVSRSFHVQITLQLSIYTAGFAAYITLGFTNDMSQVLAASQAASAATVSAAASAADLAGALKPFTPDAFANGLATLVGALVGAMLAYAFQRRMQARVDERNALTSAHRLMFSLLQQINTVVLIQKDCVYEHLEDPGRFISIPATPKFDVGKNLLQVPDLSFLLDSKAGRTVMYDFWLAQENYIEALNQWNMRSELHYERVQPALAASVIPNGGEVTQGAVELVLGRHLFGTIVNSTNNCLETLRRAYAKLADVKIKARAHLVDRFKTNDFTDFDMPETFGLEPVAPPPQ